MPRFSFVGARGGLFFFFSLSSTLFFNIFRTKWVYRHPYCVRCQQYTKQHSTTETFSILVRNYNFSACFRHVNGAARSLLRYLHFVIRQHSIQKLDFGFSHFLFTTLKHLPIWCGLLFIKIFAVWYHYHTIHIWWNRAFWKNKWHQWQQHQPQQQQRLWVVLAVVVSYIPRIGYLLKCWGRTSRI